MTVSVELGYLNDDGSDGESYRRTRTYYTFDEADGTVAAAAVVATAPATLDTLPQRSISRRQLTSTTYEFQIDYGVEQNQVTASDPDIGEFNSTLTFNLVGGTTHITTAIDTTHFPVSGRVLIDVHKVIGLDLKSGQVRGVDVFAPVMDFSYTTMFPNRIVTNSYVDKVFELTGKTNDAHFKQKPAGSVLFKGARGTKRGADRWELQFEFAYSPNETNLTVGGGTNTISNINKTGWQYIDVLYTDSTDPKEIIAGKPLQVPFQANVHTVYKSGNFSELKIGV